MRAWPVARSIFDAPLDQLAGAIDRDLTGDMRVSKCVSIERAGYCSNQSPSRAPRAATRGALQPRAQRA